MSEVFGCASFGLVMKEYPHPILYEFSETLQTISEKSLDPNRRLPLPDGWSVADVKGQSTLLVDQAAALRFRLAFGYISSLKITESYGAGSPFCAQVILRLPFRYGRSPPRRRTAGFIAGRMLSLHALACPRQLKVSVWGRLLAACSPKALMSTTPLSLSAGQVLQLVTGRCFPPAPFP